MKLYESKALMEMMIFALALKFIVLTSYLFSSLLYDDT